MKKAKHLTSSNQRERDNVDVKETVGERDFIERLPPELKTQILMKLPAKSVAKFNFVSKLWWSIVREKDLTDRFISQSARRPGLLILLESYRKHEFLSYSQDEPSVIYSRTHIPYPGRVSSPIRGLVCGRQLSSDRDKVICNPSTGQCVSLPRMKTRDREPYQVPHFLGYEPVKNQYKVLAMTVDDFRKRRKPIVSEDHQVFTLGGRPNSWTMVECEHPNYPLTRELCKDGILYYGALDKLDRIDLERHILVSFDLRTYKFGVIKLPDGAGFRLADFSRLVNYNGKLAIAKDSFTLDLELWVLQDIDKQEWYKLSFTRPATPGVSLFSCIGTVGSGEIVLTTSMYTAPHFILYYDRERQIYRRIDLDGCAGNRTRPIVAFLDHVESPAIF